MSRVVIAMVGGFGGTAPSLVDKAQALYSGDVEKWLTSTANPWISVACALGAITVFFVIGAAIALIYREQQLQKALLLGIGAPALIMAAAQGSSVSPKPIEVRPAEVRPISGLFSITGVAYAQDGNRSLPPRVELRVSPGWTAGECQTCDIKFLGGDGQIIASEPLPASPAPGAVNVPLGTETIVLSGANANSAAIDVRNLGTRLPQTQGPVTLDVNVNRSYWNDLSRSFGAKAVQPYDFSVDVAK
ncbi:hypothetical protein CO670_15660 [Rhizobium sp. J15]|uniref:hypothetical protein n=1 Tax=Rhizobium sp. J15 TaxID=2035450 RepID=UPI000BE93E1A|nr:hypothetical protein [Rhizobium sp. J15]PDT15927.1 hypothetical protein CO670_15660 [Rhizobium sp. J15]